MNSPIILLVAWFVINLLIKSAKDKRKIEEARRKRTGQIENKPKEIRNTVNTSRESLKRDLKKAISTQQPNQPKLKPIVDPKLNRGSNRRDNNWEIKRTGVSTVAVPVSVPVKSIEATEKTRTGINLKDDIVRGIIFSEILSEPKSKRNIRRSM